MVVVIDWVLGLGIMFGLAFVMNAITFDDFVSFLAFLTLFNGFIYWCGLLPLWTLILNIIILVLSIYYSSTIKGVG